MFECQHFLHPQCNTFPRVQNMKEEAKTSDFFCLPEEPVRGESHPTLRQTTQPSHSLREITSGTFNGKTTNPEKMTSHRSQRHR